MLGINEEKQGVMVTVNVLLYGDKLLCFLVTEWVPGEKMCEIRFPELVVQMSLEPVPGYVIWEIMLPST